LISLNLKLASYFLLFVGGSMITLTNFTLMIVVTNCLKVLPTVKLNCEPSHSSWLPPSTSQCHKPNQAKCTGVLPDAWKWNLLILKITIRRIYMSTKVKLYYDWWSVGQSVLVSGTHLGPATNFFLLFFL
jgi:hypothetical protein